MTLEPSADETRLRGRAVTDIDRVIGLRMRARRLALGLSQEYVAAEIGVAFQQVQKYEKGLNRVAASRLILIASALNCSAADLIEGIDSPSSPKDAPRDLVADFIATPGALALARAYTAIESAAVRKRISALIGVIGEEASA